MTGRGGDAPVRLSDVPALDATDARLLQALGEDPRATVIALVEDAELAHHLDEEAAAPKLSVMIDGTQYRGEIAHDHERGRKH